jgi:hypothetical protein
MLACDEVYGDMVRQHLPFASQSPQGRPGVGYENEFQDAMAYQASTIREAKLQLDDDHDGNADDGADGSPQFRHAEESATLVPVPLAMQGPGKVSWKLLEDGSCTEEQIDAVSLLALSMQRRFDARPDKGSHRLPVVTEENNHRAVWLGGGGVGKTHTLTRVVEPLAVTYYGEAGYLATAHANQAVHNLGPRARTVYSANGMLAKQSLQTPRLRLNAQSQKKLSRLIGDCGVAVIDELGCVSGALLHADNLRSTYGRCLRYGLRPTE